MMCHGEELGCTVPVCASLCCSCYPESDSLQGGSPDSLPLHVSLRPKEKKKSLKKQINPQNSADCFPKAF